MRFEDPLFLIFLLFLPFLFWVDRRSTGMTLRFSSLQALGVLNGGRMHWRRVFLAFLKYFGLALLVLALARPQGILQESVDYSEGIDIVLAVDTSQSMLAEDLKPNRLTAARETVKLFIDQRRSDRLALLVFGTEAFTQFPLTLDHRVLHDFVDRVHVGMAGPQTAIGLAVMTGLNRLKKSDSESKVMVLLSDGEQTAGQISAVAAAKLAAKMGVKIYTVGVGKVGGARMPYDDPDRGRIYLRNPDGSFMKTRLDEALLKSIATQTGGQYFRATDQNTLKAVYEEINRLETREISAKSYDVTVDYFSIFLKWALLLLGGYWVLVNTVFLRVP